MKMISLFLLAFLNSSVFFAEEASPLIERVEKLKEQASEVKKQQPAVYVEFIQLCGRRKDLVDSIYNGGGMQGKPLFGGILREVAWAAASDVNFQYDRLRKQYPAITSLAGIIGVIHSSGTMPKLLYTLDNGNLFELASEKSGDVEFTLFGPDETPTDWKLVTKDGQPTLVISWFVRAMLKGPPARQVTQYVRIDHDNHFTVVQTEVADAKP